MARYVIGKLFRPPISNNVEDSLPKSCEELSKGTIGGLEPMNFITAATPHLGSRGNKQVRFFIVIRVFNHVDVGVPVVGRALFELSK